MDFKFDKDSGNSQQNDAPGEKKNQSALLVLLLILVGGFTYVYFFTDLIKTQEVQKVEAPAPAPQAVKMPLPAREAEPAKPEKTEAPKTVATAPVTAAVPAPKPVAAPAEPTPAPAAKPTPAPAAKPAPAPAAKPAPAPAAKPAPAPVAKPIPAPAAKPAPVPSKQVEEAKPADKKPLPPRVSDKKGEKAAATKTKKPAADDQIKPEKVVKAKKTVTDSWSVVIGNYVLEEALSADMGRVRNAGFVAFVKPSARKKTAMNRLFVSDFNDRASAKATLEKLKRHTSDAFIIEQGGRFAVYAGSYLQSEAAKSEIERLKAAGFAATVKHVEIAIPSQSLTVGPFKSKKEADAAIGKLKSAGIKAILSQK